ncbi:MAG: von Willebrand factor type [Actinomycetia bacterium]|nr:von Willebrand factor type [Actinomycetes bacterium]
MSPDPGFSIKIDQNRYLPEGGKEVHAIVTVESAGRATAGPSTATVSVVIIIDTSGSMAGSNKMSAAKKAASAAVDALRDGVGFAVVAGTGNAELIYPHAGLATVNARTRADAHTAIGRLRANGGTAIGAWLKLADQLLSGAEAGIRHAILLTDGQNGESAKTFGKALADCEGRFVCDCRGVGTDWKVEELRRVASTLLGTVDIVAKPNDLTADFQAMIEAAMGKEVADVVLRVWTPQSSTLRFLKQVLPTVEDLTGRRADGGPLAGDYPLGAWGAESRDYHLCVEVPPGAVGREMRAGWAKLVIGGEVVATGNILAEWTDDEALSTRINPHVAHYTGQAELASAIQEGLQARKDGDVEVATARLGRAVKLATESGNEAISALLGKVVDVEDPATGTVRLKKNVDKADEMSLDTRSTKTVRTRKDQG